MTHRVRFLLVAMLILIPSVLVADIDSPSHCSVIRSFEKKSSKRLAILPFQADEMHQGVAKVLQALLSDYFPLAKDLSVSLINGSSATHILEGNMYPSPNGYHVMIKLFSSQREELLKLEGEFTFPQTMNDFLAGVVEQVSKALHVKLDQKHLVPFLNNSSAAQAYLDYAEGRLQLQQSTLNSLLSARQSFEKAIQDDYNYVPAYLGLSESLAALSVEKRFSMAEKNNEAVNLARQAEKELQKAKLLHPPLAKMREPYIKWYLEGEPKDLCRGEQ